MDTLYTVIKPFYNKEDETQAFKFGDVVKFVDEKKAKEALKQGVIKEIEVATFGVEETEETGKKSKKNK